MASRLLFCGYCTALDWVILPPCTVICTWTGPQRVLATSPVNVAGLDLDVEDPLLFEHRRAGSQVRRADGSDDRVRREVQHGDLMLARTTELVHHDEHRLVGYFRHVNL